VEDNISWAPVDRYLNWNILLAADLVFFFVTRQKYYVLFPPLLVFRKSKTNVLWFLENVIKLFPKLGHCSCKIFVVIEDYAKNNRVDSQPLFQGEKSLEIRQGLLSPFPLKQRQIP
jgi:hypothetical protein